MMDLAIDSRIYLQDKLDLALQELDILFNTENTELIGYPNFGTNFEQFLWQMNPVEDQIKRYLEEKIQNETLFLRECYYMIEVHQETELTNIIYVVDINIKHNKNDADERQRIYKLK